jgi:hypothetical protein
LTRGKQYARQEQENLEKSYRMHPDSRPTAMAAKAEDLRRAADEIDALESYRRRIADLDREFEWVQRCRAVARGRASR